jgi:hypothetical protein
VTDFRTWLVLHSSACKQIQSTLGVTSDAGSCEPLLVCQLFSNILLLLYNINCTRHHSSCNRTLNMICGDSVGNLVGFVGCIRVADHPSAEELLDLPLALNSACSLSGSLRCSCVYFFEHRDHWNRSPEGLSADQGRPSQRNRLNSALTSYPCAKVCNLCPLPAKAHSYTLATERHNVI